MKRNFIILLTILVFVFISCSSDSEEKKEKISYSEEISKLVSKVTGGPISSKDKISVSFNKAIITSDAEQTILDEEVFEIEPPIVGKTYWSGNKVLVFQPDEPMKFREKYKVSLDVHKLSDSFNNVIIDTLKFDFEILGRELDAFSGELTLKDKNNPSLLNYRGRIVFSEETDSELLKESISFREGSDDYLLEIFPEPDKKSFVFISQDIVRDNSTKDYRLIIGKEKLDLSEEFVKEFQVTPLDRLKIADVKLLEEGNNPKIRIEFSDEVDFDQNLSGLILVEDVPDIKIQKIGSSLILDGDFEFGGEYVVIVEGGLRSRWGTKTEEKYTQKVKFSDIKPQVKFASDGVFLPEGNQYKLQFYTANLKRVHIEVKKVYENNLNNFLRTEKLNSISSRKESFKESYINRVGVIIHNETFEISDQINNYLLSEIDLSDMVKRNDKGLYLVRLNFNPRDILVNIDKEIYRYIEEEGQIYKPIVFSNIGLTCKIADDDYHVFATDITTGKPLSNVGLKIKYMYDSYDEFVAQGRTNEEGFATLNVGRYGDYRLFLEAEYNDQRGVIKFNEMEWNISGFDISGVEENKEGSKAFIYTERGVYRPGDEINLSAIIRHGNSGYPDDRPVTIEIFNPQRKKVYELTNKTNKDGFYNFKIQTKESDQTGNWSAKFNIGNQEFNHTIKIETIVPYSLKVKIEPELKTLKWNHEKLNFDVVCNYLFGNPGAGLQTEVDLEINPINKGFPKYSKFNFTNPTLNFEQIQKNIFKGKLDENGKKNVSWPLPSFSGVPSALSIKLTATVFEKGGRPNKSWINIPIENYSHFVGIQPPKYSYVATGSDAEIPVILVDPNGKAVSGKTIKYKIYRNSKYWWWDYGKDRKLKFKTDINTSLIKEGELTSGTTHTNLNFVPIDQGSYLIEVSDESGTGHSSGIIISAYRWGGSPGGDKNAGTLALSSDKEKYYVGEEAVIQFPAPTDGSVLLTIEKGNSILEKKWHYPNGENEMVIKVPVTKEMAPNSYVTVSVIQPHSQTVNDRPIRTFGILPLMIEDRESKHFIDIQTASQFRPGEEFEVALQTSDRKRTQFTIAVVDEGLLDITQFRTPNAWSHFFKKIRLAVKTYDLFSHVIAANIGDVFKVFSIGGSMDYRESQLKPDKGKKRFKPVSLFKGPVTTDINGRAVVKFIMPEYVGSVRIMVIAARKNSYANAEKTVPVKTELIILPTLPRVVGPGEKFTIPITVFAMEDNIGNVSINVNTEGPLNVVGTKKQTLNFDKAADKDVYFDIGVLPEVGQSKVVITAKSNKYSASYNVDLMVRPSSARIYKSFDYKVEPGNGLDIDLPVEGLKGTNRATLTISNFPNINFGHRLKWLMRYPYGCIEQTTSSVFPQLYLKKFIKYPDAYSETIDNHINAGIERLRRFQISSGAFSYWPYGNEASHWGTLYGGHFMVEAKKLGYHVAEDLYQNWLTFTKREARNHSGELMYRVYRSYILAQDGNAELSEMNALKESQLNNMSNVQKWLVAAAYKLAALPDEANSITKSLGTETENYTDFSGTYGSGLRDKAMILDALVILEKFDLADELTREIALEVATRDWYSTQTIGYSLLAVGKYMQLVMGDNKTQKIKGSIKYADGSSEQFESDKSLDIEISNGFGKPINVFVDEETTSENIYLTLHWDGVPLKSTVIDENKNIKLDAGWYDEDGKSIDPSELRQGTTFYGKFTVTNISNLDRIDEVALVQVLPSGWEIVNTRLLNESLPLWTESFILSEEEYLDIRDDRIMWFFDLYQRKVNNKSVKELDFVVKLNAVTVGEFDLPGTITEAMYNNNYRASKAGKKVKVIKPQ